MEKISEEKVKIIVDEHSGLYKGEAKNGYRHGNG